MTAKSTHAKGDDAQSAKLQAELAEAATQIQKLTDLAARAQADLQNAKSRMEREAADLRAFAAEGVIRRLLPTIDNFQRAFQHLPEDLRKDEWVKGVVAIEAELVRTLADMGLRRYSRTGEQVDPARHEVILTAPGAADTVLEVLEDGYELHGKVLRPAKVKAGSGEASTPDVPPTPAK